MDRDRKIDDALKRGSITEAQSLAFRMASSPLVAEVADRQKQQDEERRQVVAAAGRVLFAAQGYRRNVDEFIDFLVDTCDDRKLLLSANAPEDGIRRLKVANKMLEEKIYELEMPEAEMKMFERHLRHLLD